MRYLPSQIEKKWSMRWLKEGTYEPDFSRAKKPAKGEARHRRPFYNLMMFPYPSAEGLHIGGVRTFTGVDIYGRLKRMQGYDVFEPIGLDGFGINAENYALKIGTHPAKLAKITKKNFYHQLSVMGNSFAWNERLETYDPDYYRWTQWIFVRMFKHGLAYRKKSAVNWCPSCKTVLADEQVISGACERCSTTVIKKELEQWFFRITKYANSLLKNLEKIDWSENVKIAQKNWIGKSEGTLIKFKVSSLKFKIDETIEVFTTRPDTIFGATYLVLAPENKLIDGWKDKITNFSQAEEYRKKTALMAEADRIAEGKEKTGIELKGIMAINPATQQEIPVWISDYVLNYVGTGAIMAVPGHDQRDYDFATKFHLPIVIVIEPVTGIPRAYEELRKSIVAVVRNPGNGNVLSINWGQKLGGNLFIGGGIEKGEDEIKAALREIQEETGYGHVRFISKSEKIHHHYRAFSKNVNRNIEAVGLLFELVDEKRTEQKLDTTEKGKFSVEWLPPEAVAGKIKDDLHSLVYRRLVLGEVYTGSGIMIESGTFTGMNSQASKERIVEMVSGAKKIQYRLRDWLISRQRYWGPPIPMIYCEKCNWQPVPEKDLPVKLPKVKNFKPTENGESPLAQATKWVNVKCPKCGGQAKRETDTMPNWAGSSWYYIAYCLSENLKSQVLISKQFLNSKIQNKLKYWIPVDWYNGGMDHVTLHLLYSRFWHKFLFDLGLVPSNEPY
ncbi:MAG: class I tRNA ligase family protein, partial [bacterium]|nr:class I tRNA ligase family protein [bacterium]